MGQLSLKNLRKTYGDSEVIRGIDLEIRDGEFMVFVGQSGCGKTTTLRMIAGLEQITSGDLLIDGQRVNDIHPADRGAAMVFQSYALYPHMTVSENLGFSLKMAGVDKAQRAKQVGRAAEVLRITELLGRFPKELSGGQRQRVAIGRAIVRKPKVFLFDEPLSNLDAALRVDMRVELSRLHAELGTTMVYVTHDQVEAMTLGDRIAVFHKGGIEQLGAPLELYNRPATEFVAGFIGAPRINFLDKPAHGATAELCSLWARLQAGSVTDATRLGIRPEHLRLCSPDAGVRAEVVLAEHLGDASIVHVRVPGVAGLLNAKVGANHNGFAVGATVGLDPDPAFALSFGTDGRRLGP